MRKLTVVLFALIMSSLFLVNVSVSDFPPAPEGEYSPWGDLNDDGIINIFDIVWLASRYGTTGTPLNVTELLLELETRVDVLNATITSLKECIVVTGSIPYDENGAYDLIIGLSKDVSGLVPSEFTLVTAVATGYKAHQMTGARQDEPPLLLEPKVSGMVFQTRVWDSSGDEYGGANWASMTVHIDYTLLFTKSTG